MNLSLPLLLLITIFSLPALPQEPEADWVSFEFSLLGWDDTIRDLYYYHEGEDRPVFIPTGAPSDYYLYNGPLPLRLYTLKTDEEEGTVIRTPQLTLEVNPETRQWLFLVLNKENGQGYRALKIPDDDRGAKPNSFLFYNFTPRSMAIQVDDNLQQIAAGKYKIFQMKTESAKNVTLQIASQSEDSEWEMEYRSRWGHPRGRKVWVFLIPGKNGGSDIRKFYKRQPERVRETAEKPGL